jgi:uncharacterized protein HemX
MWEFLGNMLEQGGVVATLFTLVVLGCSAAIVALWKQNQKLMVASRSHAQALQKAAETYAKQVHELHDKFSMEKKLQRDESAVQLVSLAKRIDELQERRIHEASDLTERVMSHIGHIDRFVGKLEATIDALTAAASGGARGGTRR